MERVLRASALLIAILAVIDPVLARAARDRETVVVLHGAESDRSLASMTASALQSAFDVSRVPVPHAAAYVVAGHDLPGHWRPPANARVFNVIPAAVTQALNVVQLTAPSGVSLDSIAPVEAELEVGGSGDRDVSVTLKADGVQLSQTTHRLSGTDTRLRVPMTFVPSQPGLVRLRVEAAMPGRDSAFADAAIEVDQRVWRVLTFDGRPAYSATFIRRALEADPRFSVATRVLTSRASAIETSAAPSTLTDSAALSAFDLIIVGAPEAFGNAEAQALIRYLRDRHGSVILLPETSQGGLLSSLSGQDTWTEDRRMEPVEVTSTVLTGAASGGGWRAAEFLWPSRFPPLAEALATVPSAGRGTAPRPAVWQMPIGSGRLAISSATDGWRARAGVASGFSAFWRAASAALAHATPPLVSVTMSRRLLEPGDWADVTVATFSGGELSAAISKAGRNTPLRVWPGDAAVTGTGREWTGAFRVPEEPGSYRVNVTAGDVSGVAEFQVVAGEGADAVARPASARNGLSALAAAAHGGRVVPADQLAALAAQISEAVAAAPAEELWHPMRSVWWLIPFTVCAAGEWWLRRNRGER